MREQASEVSMAFTAKPTREEAAKKQLKTDTVYQAVKQELLQIFEKEYPTAWERCRVLQLVELYKRILEVAFDMVAVCVP